MKWTCCFLLFAASLLPAYSVLTHESVIDAVWDIEFRQALLQRFPDATPEQLKEAHAYAYGGSLIQDVGYYPFAGKLFSDLVHYSRTGAYVEALLRDAQDLDEYSFALGAMAHYVGDIEGHPIGVNPSVGLLFPKLRQRFGPQVTYEDNRKRHLQTEFAFDVVQSAAGHYAPERYHDYIGFQVSKRLLKQAFEETYGIPFKDVIKSEDLAIGTVRFTVTDLIPKMAKIAWENRQADIQKALPGVTRSQFLNRMDRVAYEKEWGKEYRHPGFETRLLGAFVWILPKVGPLRALNFRTPTPGTEKLFLKSLDATLLEYREILAARLRGQVHLDDRNLDTGNPTEPTRYFLADEAVRDLAERLDHQQFRGVTAELRAYLLQYLQNWRQFPDAQRHPHQWHAMPEILARLTQFQPPATAATVAAYHH